MSTPRAPLEEPGELSGCCFQNLSTTEPDPGVTFFKAEYWDPPGSSPAQLCPSTQHPLSEQGLRELLDG